MKGSMLIFGIGLTFIFSGCANLQSAKPDEGIVHGTVGVRIQSQDLSNVTGDRVPF